MAPDTETQPTDEKEGENAAQTEEKQEQDKGAEGEPEQKEGSAPKKGAASPKTVTPEDVFTRLKDIAAEAKEKEIDILIEIERIRDAINRKVRDLNITDIYKAKGEQYFHQGDEGHPELQEGVRHIDELEKATNVIEHVRAGYHEDILAILGTEVSALESKIKRTVEEEKEKQEKEEESKKNGEEDKDKAIAEDKKEEGPKEEKPTKKKRGFWKSVGAGLKDVWAVPKYTIVKPAYYVGKYGIAKPLVYLRNFLDWQNPNTFFHIIPR